MSCVECKILFHHFRRNVSSCRRNHPLCLIGYESLQDHKNSLWTRFLYPADYSANCRPWKYSLVVVNNYGQEGGGGLKCSVMVAKIVPPPPSNAQKKFTVHPQISRNVSQPNPIVCLCHSIDIHIWVRITQNVFAPPPTFKTLLPSPPPPCSPKYFTAPLFHTLSPRPGCICL